MIEGDGLIGPGFEVCLVPGHAPGQLAFDWRCRRQVRCCGSLMRFRGQKRWVRPLIRRGIRKSPCIMRSGLALEHVWRSMGTGLISGLS